MEKRERTPPPETMDEEKEMEREREEGEREYLFAVSYLRKEPQHPGSTQLARNMSP